MRAIEEQISRVVLMVGLWALCGVAAGAVTITSASPQGEVAQVRQVQLTFSQAVVPLGDLRQADPFVLSCVGTQVQGQGRWADQRRWLFDFREALPPGTRCAVKPKADWKPALDAAGSLEGRSEFAFSTGGPAVERATPWPDSQIEEDQHFLLTLTGAATEASVASRVWCEVEGLGERIPARVVTGAVRNDVLKAQRLTKLSARALLVTCARPLPADTPMRLVWGAGIAAANNPSVLTRSDQAFSYRVRPRFTAEFSCERERANAPCLPIRPMSLRFSSPVARALAEQVRLKPAAANSNGNASATPNGIPPKFDKDNRDAEVSEVVFPIPQPENASFSIELPRELKDTTGRALGNAASFPLKVSTAGAPPIAKFAAAPFGIVERFTGATGVDAKGSDAMLPVTLRHVQGDLQTSAPGGSVRVKTLHSDADILTWYARLAKYHESTLTAREAGLPEAQWFERFKEADARGRLREVKRERDVATRELSLLKADAGTRRLDLPQLGGGNPRPFEVVGIPLPTPGYHVVEIESLALGAALLDKRQPMYVRSGVLVTNLGVHFKRGRESSLVWVTSLDRGRPVADAEVAVNDCAGRKLWAGRTDAAGLARVDQGLVEKPGECPADSGFFVTARKVDAGSSPAVVDVAFMFSTWQKGIESWRFNVPQSLDPEPDVRAHTVFDRPLLRAGETVSMKHFIRRESAQGLAALAADQLPQRVALVHRGSGQKVEFPLSWNGSRNALSSWNIPAAAKLGVYDVALESEALKERPARSLASGSFRVEEFRVPLIDARVSGPKQTPIAPRELPLAVQLTHLSGGGVGAAPITATALLRAATPAFAGYDEFSFQPPREPRDENADEDSTNDPSRDERLIADRVAATTDANGAATVTLKDLPPITRPSSVSAEVTFNDPNGEVQTVSTRIALWQSSVVLGVRTGSWASERGRVKFQVVALDTAGKPVKGRSIEVRGRLAQTLSTRKRMVGGFYAYDNHTEYKDLGALCQGSSDDKGLIACDATLDSAGQVELIASTKDDAGRAAQAATSVWISGQGELWFTQDNDDRIELLPERKNYAPGETARLQLRMPYREATVLVSVEREGVIDARVLTLRGSDPTIELKIASEWGPNVYVSALALRGRLREVPWYSFFTWGWRGPLEWWRAFRFEGKDYQAPTAMVDLAKPSFKLGLAQLRVGLDAHKLNVEVVADQPQYQVRQTAKVKVRVTQAGKPLAGAEVAFAAVDEGLLALAANDSWRLLDAMWHERALGVETSTGASEIIGRRHYGRKAAPAGGGGGRNPTRELFDTLLLWKPRVVLDAKGEAMLDVPFNDSLTSFRLVAVADGEPALYGTGSTTVRVSQDLQMLAGLPPLVREGDRYTAGFTLRNTTAREMKLKAMLAGTVNRGPETQADLQRSALTLPPQELVLPAGGAKEVQWAVEVPEAISITWEGAVEESGAVASQARDRVKITQLVSSAVPLRVLQATLQQLDGKVSLPVQVPADALPEKGVKRGGIDVAVQPKLTAALPGLRRFFETYPYACLEQKTSKAIGLRDAALWGTVVNQLPGYLDRDGLASYFPPREGDAPHGSDRLTAYVIAAAHEVGYELPKPARDAMLDGLILFVEGRLKREFWSPHADLDVRKLAAIEALSRHGKAAPRLLDSLTIEPNRWPTAAVIDWLNILKRVDGITGRTKRREEALQILRARLTYAGTTLRFSTEDSDFWWWLMDSADANASRLVLAVLDEPSWRDDLPRLMVGSLGRQKRGAWLTTTANLWGSLALDKFASKFEAQPVTGRSVAQLVGQTASIEAMRSVDGGRARLPWPSVGAGTLEVEQQGSGKPWLTVQSVAAVALKAPLAAGYSLTRSLTPVQQKVKGQWSRGDTLRVRVEIDAQSDMSWVVVSDPVPGGATILGSGLGRDSQIATRDEGRGQAWTGAWPAFDERGFEAFRRYFERLPRGKHVVEYTVRLNAVGRFALPPTRVEAMYAPESFGETPNAAMEVTP